MRFVSYTSEGGEGVAVRTADGYRGRTTAELGSGLLALQAAGHGRAEAAARHLESGERVDLSRVQLLPPIPRPAKILCIGLNYADHAGEAGLEVPAHPAVFARFAQSLVAHGAAIERPLVSHQLDFEGELAVVVGKGGRDIPQASALEHVGGYACFNDATLRDYQFRSSQWTLGKTFDRTGGFGPELVTPDELPPGCAGLAIETRVNGKVVQHASTDQMIFGVAQLIATLSEVMTLEPGDVIATGTPAGIGATRKPPLWLQPGDVCEVEIERIGILTNEVTDQVADRSGAGRGAS